MTIKLQQHQSQRHSPPPHLRRANVAPSTELGELRGSDDGIEDRKYIYQQLEKESPLVAIIQTEDQESEPCSDLCTPSSLPSKKRRKRLARQEALDPSVVSDDEDEGFAKKKTKKKSVKFCKTLVTKVVTRPYTNPLDIPKLFYSASDEARFRAAVHEERSTRTSVVSKAIVVHDGTVHTYHKDDNAFLNDPMFWNGTVTWY